jgi:glycosyltransferase involved in cell wall biosynthesis
LEKIKIAIVSPGYPSKISGGFGFVHARAKLYIKNYSVIVFSIANKNTYRTFEGIQIVEGSIAYLRVEILKFQPNTLAVHFPDFRIIQLVKNINFPKVAWIHGHEILFSFKISGKSKNLFDYIKKRLFLIPRQLYQMILLRKFLSKVNYVVFVSNWMKKAAERSVFKKFKNAVIIPNPVDTNLFSYHGPNLANQNKIVTVRSFHNSKYGIDVAIKAMSGQKEVSLDVYGQGKLYQSYLKLIKKNKSNTDLKVGALSHSEIPKLLSKYSLFIAPSRVEAQGVSMCEAMSCGLPIIASNIGGIPEFVRDGVDGFLVNSNDPKALFEAIKKLVSDKDLLIRLGKNARENVMNVCSGKIVLEKEISILLESIKNAEDN